MKHQHESSPRSLAAQLGKSPLCFVWYNDSKAIGQRAEPAPAPDERINFASFVCRVEPKCHGSTKIQNKHTIPTHSNIFQLTPKYSITYRLIPTHSNIFQSPCFDIEKTQNLQLLQQWHSSHHQVQQNYLVVTANTVLATSESAEVFFLPFEKFLRKKSTPCIKEISQGSYLPFICSFACW